MSTQKEALLEVRDLQMSLTSASGHSHVLEDLSLSVAQARASASLANLDRASQCWLAPSSGCSRRVSQPSRTAVSVLKAATS